MNAVTEVRPVAISDGTSSTPWTRIAGICGLVAAPLWIAMGASIASAPKLGDSADEIRTWMQANQSTVALFSAGMGLTMMLLLVFGAGLRSRLAVADRTGFLPNVFFGAQVAYLGGGLVGLTYWGVLSNDVASKLSDDVILALSALDSYLFFGLLPWASALMVSAASIVILQTRVMPKWVGGLGLVSGIATVIGTLWVLSGDNESFLNQGPGTIGFLGTLLWYAIVGVFLIRGDRS